MTFKDENYLKAYLGLGSNQGKSRELLKEAVEELAALSGSSNGYLPINAVHLVKESSVYTTEPQLYKEQDFFLNQVVEVKCLKTLHPLQLLGALQDIECRLGRSRKGQRYGPRVMDIDILLFGDFVLKSERLTLPHPAMLDRAFVLVPLSEIAPDLVFPQGTNIKDYLLELSFSLQGSTIFQ